MTSYPHQVEEIRFPQELCLMLEALNWTVSIVCYLFLTNRVMVRGATGPSEVMRPLPTPWCNNLGVFLEVPIWSEQMGGFNALLANHSPSPVFFLF